MSPETSKLSRKIVWVAACVILALVVIGFLSGIHTPPAPIYSGGDPLRVEPSEADVPRHRDLGKTRRGPNRDLYARAFDKLALAENAHKSPESSEELASTGSDRSERRAYEGAPPTIPHAIEQRTLPSCLACHQYGARVGDRVARAMNHPLQSNCIQCHVVASDPRPVPRVDKAVPNDFVGRRERDPHMVNMPNHQAPASNETPPAPGGRP